MKSWTRTLNIDDAHTLLAIARPGDDLSVWVARCHESLPALSVARRREVIRLLRDGFLVWQERKLQRTGFMAAYTDASAIAQVDLVHAQWAMSHPLPLVVADQLLAPALARGDASVPLDALDALVVRLLHTDSAESTRKTRTTVIGALEGVGSLASRGTGQHRSLHPTLGAPHPAAWAWLLRGDIRRRGVSALPTVEALRRSIPARLTGCTEAHSAHCLREAARAGLLATGDDEVRLPQ